MKILLLTCDRNGSLSVHHILHQSGPERAPAAGIINLAVVDARRMNEKCYAAACAEIRALSARGAIRHGILLCQSPKMPLVVAAIRCGLRDLIDQHVPATQLRRILRAADPELRARDLDAAVAFLRTFNGLSVNETGLAELARQKHDTARRAEDLAALQKHLEAEKDTIERRERDLRERTRRFDRQLARLQTDADVIPSASSASPFEDQERARQLDRRSAELDRREKLLLEMQNLLLQTPVGEALLAHH